MTSRVRVMLLAPFLHAYVESLGANFSPLRCCVATLGEVVSETDAFAIFGYWFQADQFLRHRESTSLALTGSASCPFIVSASARGSFATSSYRPSRFPQRLLKVRDLAPGDLDEMESLSSRDVLRRPQ